MFKLLALVTLFFAVASALPRRLEGKIVGGNSIPIEDVPHQISIQFEAEHYCGGSIIAKNWVLTTASCIWGDQKRFTIHAGSAYSQKPRSVHHVAEYIQHEKYGIRRNNIALIRVKEPFEFDETRKPVTLYAQDEQVKEGSVALVSGWGTLANGNPSYPELLNAVSVPMISKDKCRTMVGHYSSLMGEICTLYDEGRKGTCVGDAGSPLTIEGRLAGLAAWSDGCARPGNPSVYTEVAYFRNWIKEHSGV